MDMEYRMAIAFTFWQMPEEELAFLDFLDSTGVIVAYPDHWVKTEAEALPTPVRAYLAAHNPSQVFLGLDSGQLDVVVEPKIEGEEKFLSVGLIPSCLIAYSRPCFRSAYHLGKSNLAAYLETYKEGVKHAKPEWFHSWAKQVFSWAKKHAKKKCVHQGFSYPATPLVLKLVEEKRIEAVH